MIANLGTYIKPEYRDITYFHGIDFHQDIIDWSNYLSNFITLYIYLSDTDKNSSPLFVTPKSHILGDTVFPHNIKDITDSSLIYKNHLGGEKT